MLAKFLETFFRHKLLILLPAVVVPLIVGPLAILLTPPFYETTTGIWVEKPSYIKFDDDALGLSRLNPPAKVQGDRLTDLLHTRTFVMDVARRTSLVSLVGSAAGERQIQEILQRGLVISPNGASLLILRFRATTPELSFQVAKAVVDVFQERSEQDRSGQGGAAIAFYEDRMQEAQDQLTKANDSIRRYVASNPRLLDADRGAPSSNLPLAAIDPQLAELQRRFQAAQDDVARARKELDQAQLNISASIQSQESGFQVIDPPELPTAPGSHDQGGKLNLKSLIVPIVAVLVGLGLSMSLLILLVLADRSVRFESDLPAALRVVGEVPYLRVKRLPRQAGQDAMRRAVGFAAGSALPAPQGAK